MLLTKEQILSSQDLQREEVPVPEWANGDSSASVLIQQADAGLMESMGELVLRHRRETNSDDPPTDLRTWFVARVIINSDGSRMFSDKEVKALRAKSMKPIQRIFECAQALSEASLSDDELGQATEDLGVTRDDASLSG